MNKMRFLLSILAAFFLFACETEIDEHVPSAGEIDLTTYVAVGNSLTAGYTDSELYREAQLNSVGNIIASQLMHAGLAKFNQPLMKDELGFGSRLVLGVVNGELMPVPIGGDPDPANFQNIFAAEGPFHNMGVPGARTNHVLFPGYGTLNPYFGRFASAPTASVLGDAMAMNPSFFSLWLGNNDILGYAISGGEGEGITPVAQFENDYQDIIDQLTTNGAKGVLGNIPGITMVPFFNTIPYNPVVLTDEGIVEMLNDAYQALPHINFSLGQNPLVVEDMNPDYAPFFRRQLQEGEMVLLPAMTLLNDPEINYGIEVPLPVQYYLSLEQIAEIEQAVDDYNAIIIEIANANGLALADIYSLLDSAVSGIYFDAIEFSTEFVAGGVFSLDGIHLSARGSANAANEFIAAINKTYNASIPKAAIGEFDGIIFP